MTKRITKLAILLFIFAAPVFLIAGEDKDTTLALQVEQSLVGVPNTVIVVVDETAKTAILRGTVASQTDMDLIMERIHSIPGVRVIGSNLTIVNEPVHITRDDETVLSKPMETLEDETETVEAQRMVVVTDASLRSAVEDALKSEGIQGQSKIKVDTEDGIVTLTGTALSEAHADRIVALAQSVPGVVSVEANIQLRDQKRVYKVKPSDDRDKEGREVGEGESRVDDDDEDR